LVGGMWYLSVQAITDILPLSLHDALPILILSMAPWAQATIAFAVAALLAALGPEQYAAWGWRALFVAGAALSIGMMLYYRRHVVDRKSTRLNSSHVKSSYAVFCLKKKTRI